MMLAGIAHEVRNPLGGLELYAGLLRDALAGQPERLEEVARIEREVGHLKAVVSEFLEFARRPPPRLEAVRAAAAVRRDPRADRPRRAARRSPSRRRDGLRGPRRRGPAAARAAEPGPQRGHGGARAGASQLAAPPPHGAIACASRCATTARACRPSCARRSSRRSSPPARRGRGWAWRSCGRSCATTAATSTFATRPGAEACLASSCRGPDG